MTTECCNYELFEIYLIINFLICDYVYSIRKLLQNVCDHYSCTVVYYLFDTIDHSILLHRLKSWFGFTETVLSWIHSYLPSQSFSVDINGIKSPPSPPLYTVPQGSVLGCLLFILYTTPLSTIISRSSVNHKLYADDTQLFLSFSADAFSEKIQLLQDTISEISTWMAYTFLSLNPTKTEFPTLNSQSHTYNFFKYK